MLGMSVRIQRPTKLHLLYSQIHARLGEILYISAASSQDQINTLAESVRRFCRSIELCDGYLRGSYGLKLVRGMNGSIYLADHPRQASEKLMGLLETSTKQDSQGNQDDQLPVPSVKTLQKLRESATSVLAETARQAGGNSSNPHQIVFVRDSLKAS